MKPATSLCSWRELAGTRRFTSSSPPSATRQITPITSMPYITVDVREDLHPRVVAGSRIASQVGPAPSQQGLGNSHRFKCKDAPACCRRHYARVMTPLPKGAAYLGTLAVTRYV